MNRRSSISRLSVGCAALLAVIGLALAGCGSGPSPATSSPGSSPPASSPSGANASPAGGSAGPGTSFTGTPLFPDRSVTEVIMMHITREPDPPSSRVKGIPADLERVVVKCLAKEPSARYQSVTELERALAACVDAGRWTAAARGPIPSAWPTA